MQQKRGKRVSGDGLPGGKTVVPCAGLEFDPKPGPQLAVRVQARPRPAIIFQARPRPAN